MLTDTTGIHHVSAIAGDPQLNLDFHADVLGLHFARRTVNFEEPFVYHLYYGDGRGSPGSVLTFFAYPREVAGRVGRPGIRSASLAVSPDAVDYWLDRFDEHGVAFDDPTTRFGETVVPFRDPDGTRLELVADERGDPVRGGPVPAGHAIRGVRGVSLHSTSPYVTASLLDTFGFDLEAEEGDAVRYRLPGGRRSTVDLLTGEVPYAREGRGSIHHVALGVEDEAALREWRDLLVDRGFDVSRVKDRHLFHSLYVRDPGGVLFELATEGPGVGEGTDPTRLWLPPWLEEDRDMIEPQLPPLALPDGDG